MSYFNDLKEIETCVRKAMDKGAVTPYYSLPLERVHSVLDAAIALEILCVLRYRQHYYMTTSIHQAQLQELFMDHWHEEQKHVGRIAERLTQLGGVPNFNPDGIVERAVSRFESGRTLAEHLREDLFAERVVIKVYSDIIEFFGTADPVSRRMFEDILSDEEDHADEIASLLFTIDPVTAIVVEQFTGDSTVIALKVNR